MSFYFTSSIGFKSNVIVDELLPIFMTVTDSVIGIIGVFLKGKEHLFDSQVGFFYGADWGRRYE